MALGRESYAGRRDTVAFVVCLLLSVIARADPLGVSEHIARGLRSSVLFPFLSLQAETQEIRDRRAEYDRLRVERDSAVVAAQDLVRIRAENVRLRTLLGLANRIGFDHVAAEVLPQIGQQDMNRLVITAGRNHGITEWAPVITAAGLVGYVYAVDAATSVVYAWTHPDFRASASTLDGAVTGLVAPRSGVGPTTTLELREVPHLAAVEPGTPIFTTGLGGVYPRGVRIGWAGALLDEQVGLSKTFRVDPAVHPAGASHVLILLLQPGTEIDLSPLFGESVR